MRSERELIRAWLSGLVDQSGRGVKKKLAEHLGVRPEALSRILGSSGEPREITGVELARAAEFFSVPLPDFSNGQSTDARVTVPLVSWVSAGRMSESEAQPRADTFLSMPDLEPGDYIALKVQGDSMNRISPDGSVIVVNRRDQRLVSGQPYVFAIRGEATFKLWRPGPPPRLEPYSTNPANEPIFPDKRRKLFVVGRVRRTLLDL